MKSLLQQTWDWTLKLGKSRYSMLALFILLFIDASFFPFPTTVIFITISLLYPLRTNFNALIATLAMVAGSVVGYCIGHFLWISAEGGFTGLAQYFFNHIPGFSIDFYQYARELYLKWSYGILFLSILLPIPYQVYSITAGAFDVNLLIFSLSTFLFQGLRFFLLALLVIRFGEEVKTIFHKNLKIIAITTSVIVITYIVVAKFFQ
jgi:membrane protein YqaA with SNARE-associated domain